METTYTNEKNCLILISLLKENNIRKIIASPGTTNISFVRSVQNDPYFQVYSVVDERSAAYMACGMAAESGEPVVLSCTGATASRNYMSALTEAYYRKLPVITLTSARDFGFIGHHIPQVIDRSTMPNDTVKFAVDIPIIKDSSDIQFCELNINKALLETRRNGGGPVNINMATSYSKIFDVKKLPQVRTIERFNYTDVLPELSNKRTAILVGSHEKMNSELVESIDEFCKKYNSLVLCDYTSNYNGKYRVVHSISSSQNYADFELASIDVLIHIGEITGDYSSSKLKPKEIWRVNEDGEIRDTFGKLKFVFEMKEETFFNKMSEKSKIKRGNTEYYNEFNNHILNLRETIPSLPFSNVWVAKKLHSLIPSNSVIHFAILNSLRSWNFFEIDKSITTYSNVGGFGIDGCLSSLIGSSLVDKKKLHFGIIGDLSFFYDLNSIANRNIGSNLRILLVNNGKGVEFRNFNHPGFAFGEETDDFIAAGGHNGNKSATLVKGYSESLGFEYISASNKEEFEEAYGKFVDKKQAKKPIVFEVFTDTEDESNALEMITSISSTAKKKTAEKIKKMMGTKNVEKLKKIIKK